MYVLTDIIMVIVYVLLIISTHTHNQNYSMEKGGTDDTVRKSVDRSRQEGSV